jgi:hypothetical protein
MRFPLNQLATYWGSPTPGGFGGHTFDDPQEILVRWEEKNEEFVDNQGNSKISMAVVYADTDLEVGGYLFLGTSLAADPTSLDDALPIQRYAKMPDIRAVSYLRKAWL